MSKQKPSHEFEGIVCRPQRMNCVESQISGRVKARSNSLAWMPSITSGGNQALLITWPIPGTAHHLANTRHCSSPGQSGTAHHLATRHCSSPGQYQALLITWPIPGTAHHLANTRHCSSPGQYQALLITWPIPGTAHHLANTRHCSSPGIYHPYGEAKRWQHHACFSAAGTGRRVRIERKMNGAKSSLMKTCSRALRISDWGEGSPSKRTTTLNTQPRQRKSCFGTSLWVAQPEPGLEPNRSVERQ